jgi:amino acid transporter
MWFFVILVQFFTGCSAMLANARMAYAFARDEALPLSGYALSQPHSTSSANACA